MTSAVYRIVMLTSSYPLYEGDATAPFIEEIAAGLAARGHEVHVVLPAHPRLRRGAEARGVHLHPFAAAPVKRWGAAWGYAGSLAGDVSLTKAAVAVAPFALASAALRGWQPRAARASGHRSRALGDPQRATGGARCMAGADTARGQPAWVRRVRCRAVPARWRRGAVGVRAGGCRFGLFGRPRGAGHPPRRGCWHART